VQPHLPWSLPACCALSRGCWRPLSLPSCPPSPTSCPRPVSGRGGQGPWGPRGSWGSSPPACGSTPWCSSPLGCSSALWLLPVPLPMAGDSRWWWGRWCPSSQWGWGSWSPGSPCTPQLSTGCRAPLRSTLCPAASRSHWRLLTMPWWSPRTVSAVPALTWLQHQEKPRQSPK
ncbi:unnamed protein product, partial [Bubo scandiacus]